MLDQIKTTRKRPAARKRRGAYGETGLLDAYLMSLRGNLFSVTTTASNDHSSRNADEDDASSNEREDVSAGVGEDGRGLSGLVLLDDGGRLVGETTFTLVENSTAIVGHGFNPVVIAGAIKGRFR